MKVVLVILIAGVASGFIGAILFYFFRKKEKQKMEIDEAIIPSPQKTEKDYFAILDSRLREGGQYLRRDFSREELERMLGVGKNHIAGIIRDGGGFPNLYAYIRSLRLEHALSLMSADPWKKINDIAMESGFDSTASFIRIFKQAYGDTPSHYRRSKLFKY